MPCCLFGESGKENNPPRLLENKNNIIKYLKYLYDKKYWWMGTPTGYKKIETLAKLDKNVANKVRSTLETLDIIGTEQKTIGKRSLNVTKLNKGIQEAIKTLFKN